MRRSTTRLHLAIAVVLLAALDGPARAAAKYDYDPSVDFSKYKSFRFLGEGPDGTPRAPRNPQGRPQLSPLVEKQIGDSVKAALQGKGLELKAEGPADLGVVIHTGQHREVVGYGWGPRYTGPRRVEVNKEGVLTIDLVDRAARELVWRGSIAATIKQDPEKLHKQIDSLVEKVLKKYPPSKK